MRPRALPLLSQGLEHLRLQGLGHQALRQGRGLGVGEPELEPALHCLDEEPLGQDAGRSGRGRGAGQAKGDGLLPGCRVSYRLEKSGTTLRLFARYDGGDWQAVGGTADDFHWRW